MDLPAQPPAPTWIDFSPDSVRGQDLLGLRLPVQSIGLSLLNGVTTISPKVRYLSFRTFIADAYRTAPGPPPDSHDAFLAFARQAEAAFALGNALVDPDVTNVTGIDKARQLLGEHDTELPLERLVDQLAVNAYAGPSRDLHLVGIRPNGAPSVDEKRGLPLANVLRESWGVTALGRRILKGEAPSSATRTDLEEFGRKCHVDQLLPQERDLLLQAIFPEDPDPDEVERLRTYALLMHLANGPKPRSVGLRPIP